MGAPYHPSTNGQAERYVQTFKQKLKALRCSKSQLDVELANILISYRKMIHPSTGQSPSMMMFGRQIKSRLDLMLPKNPGGRPTNPVARSSSDGDRVRVRDFLSGNKWQFGTVVTKVGKLRYDLMTVGFGRDTSITWPAWDRISSHSKKVYHERWPRITTSLLTLFHLLLLLLVVVVKDVLR
nr:uncharacterized protein LOC115268158 [Aedes albopictus]XP_029732073.1 uncharacterized protein LOC115268165 [Aedes albopictus]